MKYDVKKIATDIQEASIFCGYLRNTDDGGTCNFDSAYLKARGMREETAKAITTDSGVNCFLSNSRIYGRILHIGIGLGQANRRTVMAEAARKFLAAKGHDVGMYYQMD